MAGKDGAELQYLERYYEKNGSQLVILYGQKNIGMHDVIRTFCQDKPHSYYKARPCSEREQLFLWGNELQEEGGRLPEYPQYTELFDALIAKRTPKRIIVIDEFQNIVKHSKTFMAQLISFIKNAWNGQQVMVLLCSASIGWIENSMVSRIGAAAYEITGFIKIRESRFADLRQYFSRHNKQECLEFYAVLGGFPELWRHFDREASVKDNICEHILKTDSFLHEEAVRLVSAELREPGVYHAILTALAAGKQKLNDLYLHTGFSRAKISVYLKNLMELEIVEKIFSYDTAGRENTQKGIYRIKNRLILFYFRYLYPHMSSLAVMTPEQFYQSYIEQELGAFSIDAFKTACREALEAWNTSQKLPFVYNRSGEWVGKVGSIDFIAEDEQGHTLIALCNEKKEQMSYEDYEWLLFCAKKARLLPNAVYLFSATGFDERLFTTAQQDTAVHLIDMLHWL